MNAFVVVGVVLGVALPLLFYFALARALERRGYSPWLLLLPGVAVLILAGHAVADLSSAVRGARSDVRRYNRNR